MVSQRKLSAATFSLAPMIYISLATRIQSITMRTHHLSLRLTRESPFHLLAAACCCILTMSYHTSAQSTNITSTSTTSHYNPNSLPSSIRAPPCTPNFTNPPTTLALVLLTLTLPTYLICLYHLIRRRSLYPIAGRSFTLLLILSIYSITGNIFDGSMGLLYPHGIPCTLMMFGDYMHAVPAGIIYALRGWILVFRIEIMNYLDERRWRQEKLKQKVTVSRVQPQQVTHPISPRASMRIQVQPTVPLEAIDEDGRSNNGVATLSVRGALAKHTLSAEEESTIPGFWFITHRRYIAWYFLRRVIGVLLAILTTLSIMLVHDPDFSASDYDLHQSGVLLPDESIKDTALFGKLTIFNAPQCPSSSLWIWTFEIFLLIMIFPFVAWCSWRIRMDSKRREKRQKERLEATGEQMIGKSLASSNTLDLDDTTAVKHELQCVIAMGLTVIFGSLLIQIFANDYTFLCFYFVTVILVYLSIITPLRISFQLSKRLRARGKMNGIGSDNKPSIPLHRQPYYQLSYILSIPSHSSTLLTFLQKEHSSENILFLTEAQQFTTAARRLEEVMNWPQQEEMEEMLSVFGGGGSRPMSPAHAAVNVNVNGSRPPSPPIMSLQQHSAAAATSQRPHLPPLLSIHPASASSPRTLRTQSVDIPSFSSSSQQHHPPQYNPEDTAELLIEALRLRSHVQTIQQKYFDKSAVYEVNLPQQVQSLIVQRGKELREWFPTATDLAGNPPPFPLSTLYREVYSEIYKLIERDSFRRFVLTPAFELLLTRADELEAGKMEQQTDLVAETANVVEHALMTLHATRDRALIIDGMEAPLLPSRISRSTGSVNAEGAPHSEVSRSSGS